jgi:hypothetical protein
MNKLTWYSKLIAAIVFIALPFVGFYYGEQYGRDLSLAGSAGGNAASTSASDQSGLQNPYYSDFAAWQTDANSGIFSIAYPIDFQVDDNFAAIPSTDWRVNSDNTSGVKYISLAVPRAFEPQTNFADATLTVGSSGNKTAVAECMTPDPTAPGESATSSQNINGTEFTVFRSNDAGAGNYYETTSYRTIYNGKCFAVEYTVHSSQIANYPASYNLKPFSEDAINSLLQNIVSTFKFQ